MATTKKTPIGLTLPLRDGDNGYFEQSYDTFTQTRMNLINLLRTKTGERRMQPTFGSRLWTVVFEPNEDMINAKIENIIREDVAQWVSGVTIQNISIQVPQIDATNNWKDIYSLLITVSFIVNSVQQQGTVQIQMNNSGKV